MAPRLLGQNCIFSKFLLSLNSKRDLDTKKTTSNIEVCPESLGTMLEYDILNMAYFKSLFFRFLL